MYEQARIARVVLQRAMKRLRIDRREFGLLLAQAHTGPYKEQSIERILLAFHSAMTETLPGTRVGLSRATLLRASSLPDLMEAISTFIPPTVYRCSRLPAHFYLRYGDGRCRLDGSVLMRIA